MSAYNAKWHEVVTDVFALRVGYSITFTAINSKLWKGLPEETRGAMTAEVRKMEDNAWTKAEANEKLGLACLTGGDGRWARPGTPPCTNRARPTSPRVRRSWTGSCSSGGANAAAPTAPRRGTARPAPPRG
ncbi:type 2 periplasmic-binding domain-containing protein [Paracoccus sphaerophysae]|uniref:hypothetical protein n=1 Tax=Paracoccus sphaerophysae TaxID=690417 RepID=UPI000A5F48EA|nr:hypothetical protein [Paracoccus sphaerophysae]